LAELLDFRDVYKFAQLLKELNGISPLNDLSKEVERILVSTSPEDEFMALAIWSGKCSLIHKLAVDKYPISADEQYKVPDLFVVFEHNGKGIPALVEVKSDYTPIGLDAIVCHKLSPSYRIKLRNYGKLLGLPVLVAQKLKPLGMWILVDLETIGINGTNKVNSEYDLSSELLGFFSLVFRKGITFRFQIEKTETKNKHDLVGVLREAHWETPEGVKITKTKSPMILLFGLGQPVETQQNDEIFFRILYTIPDKIGFFNYQALVAAISLDKKLKNEKYPWYEIIKSGKYPLLAQDILEAKEDSMFFEFAISTKPKEMPKYLT
jgi:hypothetical protein